MFRKSGNLMHISGPVIIFPRTGSLENIDGLQHMNELIDQLQKKGAEIELYEDDRVVETEFLKKYH